MLQLTNSLNTFCGRGSDLGDANLSSIYAETRKQSFTPFYHLGQYINRSKTLTQKAKYAVYPKRDSCNFMRCYVWGMCYLFVMCKDEIVESGKLFPSFANLCRSNTNSQVNTKNLAPIFNKLLDTIWIEMDKRYSSTSDERKYIVSMLFFTSMFFNNQILS